MPVWEQVEPAGSWTARVQHSDLTQALIIYHCLQTRQDLEKKNIVIGLKRTRQTLKQTQISNEWGSGYIKSVLLHNKTRHKSSYSICQTVVNTNFAGGWFIEWVYGTFSYIVFFSKFKCYSQQNLRLSIVQLRLK